MALEDRIKALTPEQRARAKQCKSAEELLALAKEEGYELTDDRAARGVSMIVVPTIRSTAKPARTNSEGGLHALRAVRCIGLPQALDGLARFGAYEAA